jgi:apolipoprotein N-acyltransferase
VRAATGGRVAPSFSVNWRRTPLRLWPWLAAIASGLACTACFPPFDQTWLCWIALTPLLAAVWFSGVDARRRWLRNLLLGYVAGLTFFWSVFSWLTTVTVLGWFLLMFYMAVYYALWAWFAGIVRPGLRRPYPTRASSSERVKPPNMSIGARSPWLNSWSNMGVAFLLACGWVAVEWVRGWMFSGWGWNSLGSALHRNLPLMQIVEYTGVAGLSFITAFVNVIALTTVRRFILETHVRPMRPHYDLTLTMVAVLAVFIHGMRALQVRRPMDVVRVAAVQSNISRDQKSSADAAQTVFDRFTRLSEIALRANPPPDLLLWPESALPGPVLSDETTHRYVMDFAASSKADLLLGSIDFDKESAYNAALLVSNGGNRVQVYRKIHLVAFGEYIPGRHTMPLFAQIIGDQVPADFAFGQQHTVFRLTKNDVQVAPLICFEDTLGDLTRHFILEGANLIANVTNDGWFLESAGSKQHLANAVFRCVESRRPMVRAANTGVTCFVDQFGRITQQLRDDTGNTFTEGVLTGEVAVPTSRDLTFFTRHGDLISPLSACVGLIVLVVNLPRLFKRRRPRSDDSAAV